MVYTQFISWFFDTLEEYTTIIEKVVEFDKGNMSLRRKKKYCSQVLSQRSAKNTTKNGELQLQLRCVVVVMLFKKSFKNVKFHFFNTFRAD